MSSALFAPPRRRPAPPAPAHHPSRLISDYLAEKKCLKQEFRRPHQNHLTSINSEFDRHDNVDVRIAQQISDM